MQYYQSKHILVILLALMAISCVVFKDRIVTGQYNWDEWKAAARWEIPPGYFCPYDSAKIVILKALTKIRNVEAVVFASSFCDECRQELPKIISLFEQADFDKNKILIIGLDDNLSEPSGYYRKFNIKATPTLVILENDKVIGKVSPPEAEWIDSVINILENKSMK